MVDGDTTIISKPFQRMSEDAKMVKSISHAAFQTIDCLLYPRVARASIQLANGKFSKVPPREEQDTLAEENIPARQIFISHP